MDLRHKRHHNHSQSNTTKIDILVKKTTNKHLYWTRPRPIFKIIMLGRSIVGEAEGKHDNFDIG